MGFLRRNVGPGNKEVSSRQYNGLVIPILEYAVPLWWERDYLQKHYYRRISTVLNESNVGPRNTLPWCHLGTLRRMTANAWSSFQSRRSYLSLLECYKTIHGLNGLNCNDYFQFNYYAKTRSNHSFKLRQPLARVNCCLHSFLVRIIKQWNALPNEIVHEQDFSTFRSKLRKYCKIL